MIISSRMAQNDGSNGWTGELTCQRILLIGFPSLSLHPLDFQWHRPRKFHKLTLKSLHTQTSIHDRYSKWYSWWTISMNSTIELTSVLVTGAMFPYLHTRTAEMWTTEIIQTHEYISFPFLPYTSDWLNRPKQAKPVPVEIVLPTDRIESTFYVWAIVPVTNPIQGAKQWISKRSCL